MVYDTGKTGNRQNNTIKIFWHKLNYVKIYSAFCRHRLEDHILTTAATARSFHILKKCTSKFDCLICEMFFIKEREPTLCNL